MAEKVPWEDWLVGGVTVDLVPDEIEEGLVIGAVPCELGVDWLVNGVTVDCELGLVD